MHNICLENKVRHDVIIIVYNSNGSVGAGATERSCSAPRPFFVATDAAYALAQTLFLLLRRPQDAPVTLTGANSLAAGSQTLNVLQNAPVAFLDASFTAT